MVKKTSVATSSINVAVDTGFGYGLMVCPNKKVKVSSFIEEIKEEQALGYASNISYDDVINGKKIVVKYVNKDNEGRILYKYFIVGEYCESVYTDNSRFVTDNRVGDEKHLIQLLSLLGLAFEKTSDININLGMGFPTKLRYEEEEMIEWLTNRFEFSYLYSEGELARNINIENVLTCGQATAPIFILPEEDFVKNILSMDFGHNTNDYLYSQGGNTQTRYEINKRGFRHRYNDMADLLLRRFYKTTKNFKESIIQNALETGTIKLKDGVHNVEDLQLEVLSNYAEEIRKDLITYYQEILDDVEKIILSGGIIENDKFYKLLIEKTKDVIGETIVIDRREDAQWNVVNGLYELLLDEFGE